MSRTTRLLTGWTLLVLVGLLPTTRATAASAEGGVVATFEGRLINLSQSWGAATACTSDGLTTRCYRSVEEMDQTAGAVTNTASITATAACTTSLRLYSSTGYSGSVLQLSSRGVAINLANYGFDNTTSSYQVGACGATFYDGANLGTPTYPGPTGANSASSSMLTGWDNRVSSIYLA